MFECGKLLTRLPMLAFFIGLTGCGFQMQGSTPLPFDTLSITIPENTQFGADVRRAIKASSPNTTVIEPRDSSAAFIRNPNTQLSNVGSMTSTLSVTNNPIGQQPASAPYQAQLQQVSETRNARVVSLNAQGRVEEYELTLRFVFRIVNSKNQIILPDTTLTSVRDMPFDDRVVQAKESEQATLFRDMQKGLVARIIRRISAPDVRQNYEALLAPTTTDENGDEPVIKVVPKSNQTFIPSFR